MVAEVRPLRCAVRPLTLGEAAVLLQRGPVLDPVIALLGRRGTFRDPEPHEVENIRWLGHFDGSAVSGILAFRDVYDPHTSATVREVIHIAGSRRAVVTLAKRGIADAEAAGLPIIATVDLANKRMANLLMHLGLNPERVTYAIGGV